MKIVYKIFLIFLVLISFAAVLLSYIYYLNSRTSIIERIDEQLNSVITLKEYSLNHIISESETHILSVAKDDRLVEYLKEYHIGNETESTNLMTEEESEDAVSEILKSQLQFLNFIEIFIITLDGKIDVSTNFASIGQIKNTDPYFIEGSKDLYVKNFYYSLSINSPAMGMAAPIKIDSEIVGVVVGRINLTVINDLMIERSGLGETGETYLIDSTGLLLTDSRFIKDSAFKKSIHTGYVNDCLNKNSGYGIFKNYRDIEVITHYVWLPESNVCMVAEMDTAEAFLPITRLRNKIIIYLLSIILLSSVMVYMVSIMINNPIKKLVEGTESLAKKDFSKVLEIKTGDEFEKLADSFNKTTKELKKSEELSTEFNKKLERDINIKTAELKQKIEEINKSRLAVLNMMEDINETNVHLKDLDVAKTNFLNVASHELKTPLTAMSAYLDVLDDYKKDFNDEEKTALDAIRRNNTQLTALIKNILETSRIESGRFELQIKEVDIRKKILMTVDNLKLVSNNKGVSLIAEVSETLPKIMTDEIRFDEILNNLISNSMKFTDKGSITVKADVEKSGKFISVKVIDTGVGIPEDKIKNLFQNFYQVDSGVSRKYGGTGLGLALTKKMIENMGGTITVESVLEKGTTFTVNLPIKQEDAKINTEEDNKDKGR